MRLGNADEAVHDAPNRAEQSDKGCRRADGGQNAGSTRNFAASRHFDSFELPGNALLQPVAAKTGGLANFADGGLHQLSHRAGFLGELAGGLRKRCAIGKHAQSAPNGAARTAQFQAFGDPNRPGDERGEGKPDHHRFHDDVGVEEHAPRRQVLWQLYDGHGTLGAGLRERH